LTYPVAISRSLFVGYESGHFNLALGLGWMLLLTIIFSVWAIRRMVRRLVV
jgi:hypothetical protein